MTDWLQFIDWLGLVAFLLAACIVWLAVVRIVAASAEPPGSGERRRDGARAYPQRDAPTGTGPAQGPPRYADIDRSEQRARGDEDPPRYGVDPPHGLAPKHKPIFDKCYGVARPKRAKLTHKRDGIRLGDEATAELLKGIFGDPPPA